MKKKLLALGVAFVMLFSVAAFAGANCELPNGNDPCAELVVHREAAVVELGEFVNSLDEHDFCEANWTRIEDYFEGGVAGINAAADKAGVNYALAGAKARIGDVEEMSIMESREWGFSECGRFALRISVIKATLSWGENFVVNVQLKNQSDVDVEIGFLSTPVDPRIPHWTFPFSWYFPLLGKPPSPRLLTIKSNEIYHDTSPAGGTWLIGGHHSGERRPQDYERLLPKGNHELRFIAMFSLNTGTDSHKSITFWSNTIYLAVI